MSRPPRYSDRMAYGLLATGPALVILLFYFLWKGLGL